MQNKLLNLLYILFAVSFSISIFGNVIILAFNPQLSVLLIPSLTTMVALLSSIMLLISYLGFAHQCNSLSEESLRVAKDATQNVKITYQYMKQIRDTYFQSLETGDCEGLGKVLDRLLT